MNGPIAQLAALTCHANAFLAGRDIPPFLETNSTCQFCDLIEFTGTDPTRSENPEDSPAAADPDEWIHALPLRDVDGVRLTFGTRNDPDISDRLSAGFAGGGHVWTMQVVRDDGQTEHWTPAWRVWNQDAPENRIWRVTYELNSVVRSKPWVGRNLTIVRRDFRESLEEILKFSEQFTQGVFTRNFVDALAALDNPRADVGFHKDIAMPGQLSPEATSLLKASMSAWVFGGMGTWNDMNFEQPIQTEYENVSERLFDVLHEAIEVSVTSSYLTS